MTEVSIEQIRNYRLRSHHLDTIYQKADISELVGACGMQNTPPGAWESALYNRVSGCSLSEMEDLLFQDRSLLQAWSLRGAPVVFPTAESGIFLSPLTPQEGEPWIYTQGILLALDFLHMAFDELLDLLKQVMPQLDGKRIVSKTVLDQTLADWMLPLLPEKKRELWRQPSMYGNPDKQTVGGAVVSFLLRPCSFKGLVVFGEREGISPSFTSFKSWTGRALERDEENGKELVRKYLRCYGPATADAFASWLGCSGKQARRMWKTISEEMEPVTALGKKAYLLSSDKELLFSSGSCQRELLLLGAHDPFLDQRDRTVLQPDKALQKQIWKTVMNPGAIVYRGEVVGIWINRKKSRGMEIRMSLWKDLEQKKKLYELAGEYAAFRRQRLLSIEIT